MTRPTSKGLPRPMWTASLWMRGGLLSALLAILAIACGDGSAIVGPEDPPLGVIVSCDGTPVTGMPWRVSLGPDAALARIAEHVPGFGGMFPKSGKAVVWLMDLSLKEQAEPHVRHHAQFSWNRSPEVPIEWRRGRYDIRQLIVWFLCLRNPAWAVEGTTGFHIDERQNRIVFGVRDEAARARAESVLAGTQVPRAAVILEISRTVPLEMAPVRVERPAAPTTEAFRR